MRSLWLGRFQPVSVVEIYKIIPNYLYAKDYSTFNQPILRLSENSSNKGFSSFEFLDVDQFLPVQVYKSFSEAGISHGNFWITNTHQANNVFEKLDFIKCNQVLKW